MVWWGGGVVGWRPEGLYCQLQPNPSPLSSGPWDLGPEFGIWIWDLDLGLDLGLTIHPSLGI